MNTSLLSFIKEDSDEVDIVSFVKNELDIIGRDEKEIYLIGYVLSKNTFRIYKLYIDFIPIINMSCYRKIIMYFFYTQLAENNREKIYKIESKERSETLTTEEKNLLKSAQKYENQLQNILCIFETPDPLCGNQVISQLASNETVAPYITGLITGKYPNISLLNEIIKIATSYYDLLQSTKASRQELETEYVETKKSLQNLCNILSYNETYYSKTYINIVRSVRVKEVVINLAYQICKLRSVRNIQNYKNNTYKSRTIEMRREIISVCLKKFNINTDIKN